MINSADRIAIARDLVRCRSVTGGTPQLTGCVRL